jgi:hypothetical protein
MPHELDADDPAESPEETATEAAGSDSAPARPPRPAMSDQTPAPVLQPIVPTRPVTVSRRLWIVSFAVGSIAALFAFVSRGEQLDRLQNVITGLAPDRDAETISALAQLVFWGTLSLAVLVILIEAVVLHVMMRRHGGARWVLMFILLLHAGVLVVAEAFIIAPGPDGHYLRVLAVAQLALAGTGLVVSLLPGANVWFRAQKVSRFQARP